MKHEAGGRAALPPEEKGGEEGMPSNWLYIDTNFPSFTQKESVNDKVETMQDYLFMLVEQLRYTLHN